MSHHSIYKWGFMKIGRKNVFWNFCIFWFFHKDSVAWCWNIDWERQIPLFMLFFLNSLTRTRHLDTGYWLNGFFWNVLHSPIFHKYCVGQIERNPYSAYICTYMYCTVCMSIRGKILPSPSYSQSRLVDRIFYFVGVGWELPFLLNYRLLWGVKLSF